MHPNKIDVGQQTLDSPDGLKVANNKILDGLKPNDTELIKSYLNDKKQVDLLLQTLQHSLEGIKDI